MKVAREEEWQLLLWVSLVQEVQERRERGSKSTQDSVIWPDCLHSSREKKKKLYYLQFA